MTNIFDSSDLFLKNVFPFKININFITHVCRNIFYTFLSCLFYKQKSCKIIKFILQPNGHGIYTLDFMTLRPYFSIGLPIIKFYQC